LQTLQTWTFNITAGYNVRLLPQATLVPQGSFIILTQTTGKVAVDSSNNATFSDLAIGSSSLGDSNSYYKLQPFANQRFFMKVLSNLTTYQNRFSVTHTYANTGLYNLNITFASSADSYQYLANVTERNLANFKIF
jgi:hypothetical protein